MFTVRPDLTTQREGAAFVTATCVHCHRLILWLRTYLGGRQLPFDPQPVLRSHDDGTGWIPGEFIVDCQVDSVYAPLPRHQRARQLQARTVWQLHRCVGAA